MRKIAIRIDDVCPTMDYEKFGLAMEILQKNDIKPLLGIIPNCKDPDLKIETPHDHFWEEMRQLQLEGCQIAMHGYEHLLCLKKRGMVNIRAISEFVGLSYDEQYEKIRDGKSILNDHGIFTDIFFAPAHSYDKNTLRALKANGFRYISDGKSGRPYAQCGIKCIPCRAGGIPKIKKQGFFTAVIHPNEWSQENKALEADRFINFCNDYSGDFVGYEEFLDWEKGNYIIEKLSEKEYLLNERYIHRFLSKGYHVFKEKWCKF